MPGAFPQTRRFAAEFTSGTDHERFDFTIVLILDGLLHRWELSRSQRPDVRQAITRIAGAFERVEA
ncbi:hypothetical protein AB0D24_25935 [Streptomyces javensis]|uniref:hypothetical protein n=1 Tax=Streptomyces javensis TaxID=114698 RepID=UPI0033F29306